MKKQTARGKKSAVSPKTESYKHTDAESPLRPEIGTQSQFKKKKAPKTYRYDSSLSPSLEWDGQNSARERGEELLKKITDFGLQISDCKPADLSRLQSELIAAVDELKAISKPFLNWAGKAERLSFDVPTLPLFVHERLSTKAIIETLKGHKRDKQIDFFDLFGDPQHSITDQVLKAYEYMDKWVNRGILGDSLVVMNSLLHYEGMGGQVQMIYMDPPYGVKFGSNFQPFVRKRDVTHNDDEDMTREPEMVKAYRDTWELGLHSYLTYMRDRLLLARDLLTPSGSIFVQISDENVHHVREVMDEVFGAENFLGLIAFAKTAALIGELLSSNYDYILWYARDKVRVKYYQLYTEKVERTELGTFTWIELPDGSSRRLTSGELKGEIPIPEGRRFRASDISGQGETQSGSFDFEFEDRIYHPSKGRHWSTNFEGMEQIKKSNRIISQGNTLAFKRYENDFPFMPLTHVWNDTIIGTYSEKFYVVQTGTLAIQRCMLMTTDPGDLVLDPTCGSGTTAYVAEQWGRRWITIDTSRVPLALMRQRILTATYPYYKLKDESRGPAGGFVYERKQNSKGEEVGGIVPHVTLKSIANNEPPSEEVLVDRPEENKKITRVTGPFCIEATIPTPVDWEGDGIEDSGAESQETYGNFVDRMIEILRKSPLLHLDGGKKVLMKNIRPPAKSLSLSAEALVNGSSPHPDPLPEGEGVRPVAIVFGPENGAVSEKLVFEAAREAHAKNYFHLYVIGFGIQAHARQLIDNCEETVGIKATYVQVTLDIMMGDLLKNMRSSQIFSVCGLPEIVIHSKEIESVPHFQVELLGLDVFDPVEMKTEHRKGDDVPAWFLDTDYNGLCFHVSQAFFPRTSAWDNLKRALKGLYEESVWDHLSGTTSAPFESGEYGQIAVKVIDDRGNELLVVKKLEELKR